jgi:hypothetical protein
MRSISTRLAGVLSFFSSYYFQHCPLSPLALILQKSVEKWP